MPLYSWSWHLQVPSFPDTLQSRSPGESSLRQSSSPSKARKAVLCGQPPDGLVTLCQSALVGICSRLKRGFCLEVPVALLLHASYGLLDLLQAPRPGVRLEQAARRAC